MSKPVRVYRVGSVTASVFLNEIEVNDAKKQIHNVRLERRYRTKEGEWQSTSSFGLADLAQAKMALELSAKFVADEEAEVSSS